MNRLLTRANILHLVKELIWLILTGILVHALMYPITSKMDFIYWKIFGTFIFISLTYFRYSILFKTLPFLRPTWIRFLLFVINLTLFMFLMYHEQKLLLLYQNFYTEDFGFPKIIFYDEVKEGVFKYLYLMLTLFGTGSLIMISAFQSRLIISYWQYYKHQADNLMD
ncbi:MAG: hypothetical protein IPP77_10090 [Bacteroidetes bacterium]|nr:hypothetical protein [Bacteroidota bacterium]